jgi:hypothetical protein
MDIAWIAKKPLNACYAPFLPELLGYQSSDGALHVDVNNLDYFLIVPRAFDTCWAQWYIQCYLYIKWVAREYII